MRDLQSAQGMQFRARKAYSSSTLRNSILEESEVARLGVVGVLHWLIPATGSSCTEPALLMVPIDMFNSILGRIVAQFFTLARPHEVLAS